MVFQKVFLACSGGRIVDRSNCDSRKNGYNPIIDKENKKKADKINLKLTSR
jgi:hypothetical protein